MTRARFAILLALAFPSILPCVPAHADDIPAKNVVTYPRGGPGRTGSFPWLHLLERPATEWVDDVGGHAGTPVIAGDRMILGNRRGELIGLNLGGGEELWRVSIPRWDIGGAPVVVGDRIYCSSNEGVSAHKLADGEEIWRHGITGETTGASPLVVGDLVIVGVSDGFVYALDLRTGDERWKADIVTGAPADPEGFDGARARLNNTAARPGTAASDGRSVFLAIFDQSRVVALDLKTGEPRWSYQTKGWIAGMPAVAEGMVFFGSQDRKIYAVDAASGKLAWTFEARWRADGDLAYCDGSIFAACDDGRCYRIDAKNGKKIWEYETEVGADKKHYFLSGAPLVDATAVYFGSWDGYLYALKREDGTLKWRHRPHVNGEHVGAPITDGKNLFVPLSPGYDFEKQQDKPGVHGIAAIVTAKP